MIYGMGDRIYCRSKVKKGMYPDKIAFNWKDVTCKNCLMRGKYYA